MKRILILLMVLFTFNVFSQEDSLQIFDQSTVFGLTSVTGIHPEVSTGLNFSIEQYFKKGGYISIDINESITITGHKYFLNGVFIGTAINNKLKVYGILGYSYNWISVKTYLSPMQDKDPIEIQMGFLTELSIPITPNGTIYSFYDINTISDQSTNLYHTVGIGFKYLY